MSAAVTQAERLTRIETLLEADLAARKEERRAMREKIDEMGADLKAIRAELETVKNEQAALKNKGAGFLAGAALAGGAVATGLAKLFGG